MCNISTTNSSDPLEILKETDVAIIKNIISVNDLFTCFSQTKYDVYININGKTIRLFQCQEQSGICVKNFCPIDYRPVQIAIKFVGNNPIPDEDFSVPYIVCSRPLKFTCFCFSRYIYL